MAAAIVGAIIAYGSGLAGLLLLLLFFLTASLLTTVGRSVGGGGPTLRPDDTGPMLWPADTGRSAAQVVANGGVASAVALLGVADLIPHAQVALAGALAAATADTWATEIGTAVAGPTRLITSWRKVRPGSSGGVSPAGTLAGLAGALFIGVSATLLFPLDRAVAHGAVIVAAGALGALVDSIAGATVEGRVGWVDNDVVNLLGTGTGAAAAWLLSRLVIP